MIVRVTTNTETIEIDTDDNTVQAIRGLIDACQYMDEGSLEQENVTVTLTNGEQYTLNIPSITDMEEL